MGHRLTVDIRQIDVTAINPPLLEIGHHPFVGRAVGAFVIDGDRADLRHWAAFSNKAVFRDWAVFKNLAVLSPSGLPIGGLDSITGIGLLRSIGLLNHGWIRL